MHTPTKSVEIFIENKFQHKVNCLFHATILASDQIEKTVRICSELEQHFNTICTTSDRLAITLCFYKKIDHKYITRCFPAVVFIFKSGCPGFGSNHNFAIRNLQAKWYLLSNDDLIGDITNQTIKFDDLNEEIIYSPYVYEQNIPKNIRIKNFTRSKLILHAFGLLQLRNLFPRRFGKFDASKIPKGNAIQFVSPLISGKMLNEFGLLSEKTRYWGEDLEFCERARFPKIRFLKHVIVYHEASGSTGISNLTPRTDWPLMRLVSALDLIIRRKWYNLFPFILILYFFRGKKFRYFLYFYLKNSFTE